MINHKKGSLLITLVIIAIITTMILTTLATEPQKITINNTTNYHTLYHFDCTTSLSGQFDYSENITIQYELTPEELTTLNDNIEDGIKKETIIEDKQYKDLYIIRIVKTPQGIDPNHLKIVAEINPSFFT